MGDTKTFMVRAVPREHVLSIKPTKGEWCVSLTCGGTISTTFAVLDHLLPIKGKYRRGELLLNEEDATFVCPECSLPECLVTEVEEQGA